MARYAGTTLLTMSRDAVEGSPGAKFLQAVQQAVGADYDVIGELGRRSRTVVYLAREAQTTQLVALRLQPAPGAAEGSGDFTLDVVRQLDGSLPATKVSCPRCSRELESWGRYCSRCGADLAGVIAQSGDEMLSAVKDAARGKYDVVGRMPRAEGGGVVYFAREIASGKLVALRLQKEGGGGGAAERYVLDQTQVIKSVAEELGVSYGATATPTTINAPPPTPVVPVVPVVVPPVVVSPPSPPPPPRWRFKWNAQTITLAATGALALVFLAFVIGRRSSNNVVTPSEQTVPAKGAPPPKDTTAALALVPSGEAVKRVDSGSVRVEGAVPKGAQFSVDGEVSASEPDRPVRVAPGAHRLRLTAPGFIPAEEQVNVEPGETFAWGPQLSRPAAPPPKMKPVVAPPTVVPSPPPTVTRAPDPEPAPTCLSLFGKQDYARAMSACQAEANAGNANSQLLLASMYDPLRGGTNTNGSLALKWYTDAANAGMGDAAYRLGVLRRDGAPGVSRDDGEAYRWFKRATDLGNRDAELPLADAYYRGKGTRQNKTEAALWYAKSADHGVPEAQYQLGLLYAKGDALAKNDQTAVSWFVRAATQGHAAARDELAKRGIKP